MAIIAAHAQATRSQVTAYRHDLRDELDAVIVRALGVAPDQRYATCEPRGRR